jgi:hypothetical protein
MPIDPEGVKDCFDPKSKACAACLMVENYEDLVLCHIVHLEQDLGIRVIKDKDGYIKIHEEDQWKMAFLENR